MIKSLMRGLAGSIGYEVTKKPSRGQNRTWPIPRSRPMTYYETEEWFHGLYDQAQAKTQMKGSDNALRRQRHYTLNHLVRKALDRADGEICEIGCWRGLSTYQIAQRVRDSGKQLTMHVFDSFQGLSEYRPEDMPKDQQLDIDGMRSMVAYPLEAVKANLQEFDFIKFYPGWVPERFHEVAGSTFSFIHIDVDLYQPIRDCFEFFYPLLAENGIMVFDDYGCPAYPGAMQAVDEGLAKLEHPLFVPLPSGQAFLVKK